MKKQNRSLSRKALNRLSRRAFRSNRARNIFAILAVLLTTLMLTCVFSIGFSFSKNLATMERRIQGNTAQLRLPHPTQEQLQKLRALPYLQATGTEIIIGAFPPSSESDAAIQVMHLDETQWEYHIKPCIDGFNGRLPQAENEVMLSSHSLSLLGIDKPRIGMEIKLSFPGAPKTPFILCGWYTEYTENADGKALLSGTYCNAHSLTAEQQGTAMISVKKGEETDIVSRLMIEIQPPEDQFFLGGAETPEQEVAFLAVFGIVMLVLLIAVSGYLLIANVLNLSVAHEIRFYGMLKALGAQDRQLRRIVRRQALLFAAIGIVAGLTAGALACFVVVPFAMRFIAGGVGSSSAFPAEVSFQPLIFVGAAFFALLTVLFSCRRPAKMAGRVSPVEALRHTETTTKKRYNKSKPSKRRTSSPRGRLARMAWRNVFRDRRRAALVFASMSLGIVLFLSVTSLMNALSGENYFNAKYPYDFACSVQSMASAETIDLATGKVSAGNVTPDIIREEEIQNILKQIRKMDGITRLDIISSTACTFPFDDALLEPVLRDAYARISAQPAPVEQASMPNGERQLSPGSGYADFIQQLKAQGRCGLRVYSVSDGYLEQYNHTHAQPLDLEAFRRGELCLISSIAYEAEAMCGKQFSLTSASTGRSVSLTIGGVWKDPAVLQVASADTGFLAGIYISDALMGQLNANAPVERICLNVEAENEPAVKAALEALHAKHPYPSAFSVSSKSDSSAEQEMLTQTMQVLGGGLSLLLLLIGLLNFINVMFTCVLTRRREFAVLESIGLTRRQLFSLLAWEGLFYVIVTSVISLAASTVLYTILAKTITKLIPYAAFSFPSLPAVCIVVLLLAICLLTAAVMYRSASRESVTQRLRDTEE